MSFLDENLKSDIKFLHLHPHLSLQGKKHCMHTVQSFKEAESSVLKQLIQ